MDVKESNLKAVQAFDKDAINTDGTLNLSIEQLVDTIDTNDRE